MQALHAHPSMRRQDGFSMIEVLVTMVILMLGLLGLAGLMIASQRAEVEAYQRAQALLLLQDISGRINVNRRVALCYAVTTDTANGTPYLGTGGAPPSGCALGTITADNLANNDLSAWSDLLQGAAETFKDSGGTINKAGAMVGARGCISFDTASNTYMLSIAWQGVAPTTAPISSLNCGKGLYGNEKLRRVISLPLQIANLV